MRFHPRHPPRRHRLSHNAEQASRPAILKHLESTSLQALEEALRHLDAGFTGLPEFAAVPGIPAGMENVLLEAADKSAR